MLVRLLQFLAALLLLRLLFRFVAGVLRGLSAPDPPPTRRGGATELVRDRVCNTFLPKDAALVATIGGREEHFCSAACRDKARALLKAS